MPCYFSKACINFILTFLLLQKSNKPACRQAGKEPAKACLSADRDYTPFVGWFPDLAFVLL